LLAMIDCPDWLPENLSEITKKVGLTKPREYVYSKAITQLRQDWLSDNADEREEGVTRKELEQKIQEALERCRSLTDPGAWLEVAESYGILDPTDKRCLDTCEVVMKCALPWLDKQRQGDANQIYGRSLFLAGRYEESLRALLRAQACFRDMGNCNLRKHNNVGLLRAYAALGKSKEAAERLEVALTQVRDGKDEAIMLYINAKGALEETGVARDAEVLDDIWYVYMDMHPEVKDTFESYITMGTGLMTQLADKEKGPPKNVREAVERVVDAAKDKPGKAVLFSLAFVLYLVLGCFMAMKLLNR